LRRREHARNQQDADGYTRQHVSRLHKLTKHLSIVAPAFSNPER
jgi:hypothetical protein